MNLGKTKSKIINKSYYTNIPNIKFSYTENDNKKNIQIRNILLNTPKRNINDFENRNIMTPNVNKNINFSDRRLNYNYSAKDIDNSYKENYHKITQKDNLNKNDQYTSSTFRMYSKNAENLKKNDKIGEKQYYSFLEPNKNLNFKEEEDDLNSNLNINSEKNKTEKTKELKDQSFKRLQHHPSATDLRTKPKNLFSRNIINDHINNYLTNKNEKTINNNKKESEIHYIQKSNDIGNFNKNNRISFIKKENANNLNLKIDNIVSNKKENNSIKKTNYEENIFQTDQNENNSNKNFNNILFKNININDEVEKQNKNLKTLSENNLDISKLNRFTIAIKKKIDSQKATNIKENDERSIKKEVPMKQLGLNNQVISNSNKSDNNLLKNDKKDEIYITFSEIYEKLNIFNSFLLLLSNISYTKKKMEKLNEKNTVFQKNNKKLGLSFILYQFNRSFFKCPKIYEITKEELKSNYIRYLKNLFIKSDTDYTLEEFLIDIKNAQFIIEFIFKNINKELYKRPSSQNIENNNNETLKDFLKKYSEKYSSFISDHFIGFKKLKYKNYSLNYLSSNNEFYYDFYFDFVFDLNDILINNKDNQKLKTINLTDCFKNLNNQINNNTTSKIYSLPNVLTIILKPYDFTYIDFKYPDELLLNKILFSNDIKKSNEDGIYHLVGMLCKYSYNDKFVCYYINQNNGIWYYKKDENLVKRVLKFSMNTLPVILLYQKTNTLEFEYKKLERKEKPFFIYYNYINGLKGRLIVEPKLKVYRIIDVLSSINSNLKIYSLLIDGKKLELKKTFEENGVKEGGNIVCI